MKHLLLSCLALLMALQTGAAERSPNILFLFSDDQRADTLSALGNSTIRTPSLDHLVRSGTTFTRAYCMGANQGAVCVPSRAMLMSGRTLFRVHEQLKDQAIWPEMFGKAGYTTFMTGKWHNGPAALLRSFQKGRNIFLGGMGDPYKLPVQDISDSHELTGKHASGEHSVKLFADSAVEFLQTRKSAVEPFLCYVAFNAPHDPRIAPQEYRQRFDGKEPPAPRNFLPQHPFNNGAMVIRDEELAPWPRTPEIVRQHLADYYAYIEFMDAQIARILETLESTGQRENTIIVFSSDHGLAIGSHGLFGKQNVYDHSMHAPLIISGPGIPAGRQSDAMCYLLDIFPTLGDLARVKGPEGSEGKTLLPVISGKSSVHRQSLLTSYTKVQRAVRDERWKLIVYPQINRTQLFDLLNDPDETQDLSLSAEHEEQRQRLLKLLASLQAEAGDTLPLAAPNPLPESFDFSKVIRKSGAKAAE